MRIVIGLIISTLVMILACTGNEGEQQGEQTEGTAQSTPSVDEIGRKVYKTYCILCHGADGKLMLNGAFDLTASQLSLEERIELIKNGRNTMTPFKDVLSEEEIQAVAQYSMKFSLGE